MADDEKHNDDDDQYSLAVSVIKDKLQLHLHNKATKYMYHGSFDSEELQKCGFPSKQAQSMQTVARFLESARKGHKQWNFEISTEKNASNDEYGFIKMIKDDDFFPLQITMKLKKTQRNEIDIIKEHIADLKAENKRLKAHCVPKGSIIIWSGNVNDTPPGWKLCDGQHGTPDLRNRFVIGASDDISVKSTGGTKSHSHNITVNGHQLTVAEMPSHTHRSPHAIFVNHHGNTNASLGKNGGSLKHWLDREHEKLDKVGGNQAHHHTATSGVKNHLPPYYAMCYIMKTV